MTDPNQTPEMTPEMQEMMVQSSQDAQAIVTDILANLQTKHPDTAIRVIIGLTTSVAAGLSPDAPNELIDRLANDAKRIIAYLHQNHPNEVKLEQPTPANGQ